MSLIALKSFILNVENGVQVAFEKGEAIAQEYIDHWFVKANSIESDAPVIEPEEPEAEIAPEAVEIETAPEEEEIPAPATKK